MNHIRFCSRPLASTSIVVASLLYAGVVHASGGADDHSGSAVKDTLYQALNLVLLLGVLVYFGRKPVVEFFAARRAGIHDELSESADLLAKAEQRNSKLQRRLIDLNSEVEEIRELAGRRAEEEAERILADARAAAERIRGDAEAAVAQELRRARVELREEAANLALEIAARKLSEQVVDGDRERLIDEFITRIEPNPGEGANR